MAARDTSGKRQLTLGYGFTEQHEFGPVSPDNSYENYLNDPLARVFISTDQSDLDNWPLLDNNGSPIIRSRQDSYCKYNDLNPLWQIWDDSPVGILVEQTSYAWTYADYQDVVFFYFKIKNISGALLDSVYLGFGIDCDIGNESGTINDHAYFDVGRKLGYQYQNTPEPGWDQTGVVGFRLLETPDNNTGDTVRVIDAQYPRDIAPGQNLGLTAFRTFDVGYAPGSVDGYFLTMAGVNFKTGLPEAYDTTGKDISINCFMISCGPLKIYPDSSATLCLGIIGASDTSSLKSSSDLVQAIYDNGFALASSPASPEFAFTATAGDGKAFLSWNNSMETTPDPFWNLMTDSVGWYTYFEGTWDKLPSASQLLVDSFEVNVAGVPTKIARGSANPGTDTLRARYNQKQLYEAYDFQGYLLYRADNLSDLNIPENRVPVGNLHYGSSGAHGYFYDKVDGYQIVLDISEYPYVTPDTTYYLPIYDTIGTDRGLAYGLIDTGLTNGHCYYYGISAYDYQPNVYFTRKSPTTLCSDPALYAQAVTPAVQSGGYIPPNIQIRVDGNSDSRYGGALDYFQNLFAANPKAVPNDSFKLHWGEMEKHYYNGVNYPVYKGKLYNSGGFLIDSLNFIPSYSLYGSDAIQSFNGTPSDQLPFGGIVFQPFLYYLPSGAGWDTVQVTGVYPKDSIWAQAYGNTLFASNVGAWQWRGSDYEIRWRDTVVSAKNCLTASVWDITNNVEVPLEYGVSKANMSKSSWCFNPTSATCTNFIDSAATSAYGMYICGVIIYFNKCNNGLLRRMIWSLRPHTGDIWTITCSGPTTPSNGAVATFILTPEVSGVEGTPKDNALNYFLSQNAPNPFNTTGTTISYQIGGTEISPVSLKIYNIAGQLVKTLVNDSKYPGYYSARWNCLSDNSQKVSAGIYIYRLQAGDKTITKKMVLIK